METIQKTRQGKRQAAQRSFGSKCGIFLALLLFLGCVCIRFYPYVEEYFLKEEKVTLTITNLGVDGESKASEIWMTMKKGNAVLTPSEVLSQNLIEDSGWFEKGGYVVSTREGQQLKLNNKYRVKLLVKCRNNRAFRDLLRRVAAYYYKDPAVKEVSLTLDLSFDGVF